MNHTKVRKPAPYSHPQQTLTPSSGTRVHTEKGGWVASGNKHKKVLNKWRETKIMWFVGNREKNQCRLFTVAQQPGSCSSDRSTGNRSQTPAIHILFAICQATGTGTNRAGPEPKPSAFSLRPPSPFQNHQKGAFFEATKGIDGF